MPARLRLHDDALVSASRLAGVLALLDFGDHQIEGLLHVLVVPGACLRPGAFELLGESLSVIGRDLALGRVEVGLVANDDEGDPFGALYQCVSRC